MLRRSCNRIWFRRKIGRNLVCHIDKSFERRHWVDLISACVSSPAVRHYAAHFASARPLDTRAFKSAAAFAP
jgi:hypothetical protein